MVEFSPLPYVQLQFELEAAEKKIVDILRVRKDSKREKKVKGKK